MFWPITKKQKRTCITCSRHQSRVSKYSNSNSPNLCFYLLKGEKKTFLDQWKMFSSPPSINKNNYLEIWNSNIWRLWCREQVSNTCSNWSNKYWKFMFVVSELVVGSGVHDKTGVCFQNCSELLWEIMFKWSRKTFGIRDWRPKIYNFFEIIRAIY